MKKIILALFSLVLAILLTSSPALAQYDQMVKDYCGQVDVVATTYTGSESLSLGKTSTPQNGDWEVKITQVTVDGGGQSKTFAVNQTIPGQTISAGGANFLVPGIGSFFQQATQNATSNTQFNIKTGLEVQYTEPFDISKPTKSGAKQTCEDQKAAAITVPAKAQTNLGGQQAQPGGVPSYQTPNNIYCKEGDPTSGINTAIGCIPVDNKESFVGWMLGWAIGISGGIAFVFIVFAAIQMMTAQGDPQKLSGGRELLTAAISGLILIIFSVFLLRVIGVDILHLPTF